MSKIRDQQKSGSRRLSAPQSSSEKMSQLSHPIFCFRHLQSGYDVGDCTDQDRQQLVKKLRTLSNLDWVDIQQAPKHGLGKENISRASIKVALPNIVTGDVKLWALRFNGTKAMVGFRSGPVFHLIWLDHNYSVYQH